MSKTVKKASVKTTMHFAIDAPVSLYKTTGNLTKAESYETAGPNGGRLRRTQRAAAAPTDEGESGQPLIAPVATDPGPEQGSPLFPDLAAPAGKLAAVPDPTPDPGPEPTPEPEAPPIEAEPGVYRTVLIEEGTGIEVEPGDVRRGIRDEDGEFIDLTKHLDSIDEDCKLDRFEVLRFVDRRSLPRERVIGSYYLAADDETAARLLRVLEESIKAKDRMALVRWTKQKGHCLGFLSTHRTGALLVSEVVFAEQAREPNAKCLAHRKASVSEAEVAYATDLVEQMAGARLDVDALVEPRRAAEAELLEKARAGELPDEPMTLEPEVPGSMEELRERLAEVA